MANQVFANGREVACKAGSGKTICAFPDVCFTPPENPATPPGVPIPYPNTGFASDTTEGSKTVKITGKDVMLKDKSYFKKSTGDEAGCAAKKGVITSVNRGKVYFKAWSMDVKFESENADRHLDLTTDNHASDPGDTPPWPFVDSAATGNASCEFEKEQEKEACKEYKPHDPDGKDVCVDAGLAGPIPESNVAAQAMDAPAGQTQGPYGGVSDWSHEMSVRAAANECIVARRCQLVPYNGPKDGISGCCPSQTPDHLIPQASFYDKDGYRKGKGTLHGDWPNYNKGDAPCMCAEGPNNVHGSHGLRHAHHKANGGPEQPGQNVSFDKEAKLGADGACEVFAISACHPDCIEAQLKKGHENMGKTNGCVTRRPSGSVVDEEEISPRATEYAAEAIARG